MTAKQIKIAQDRLAKLAEIVLASGSHEDFERGVCAMEAVAWLAGEKHSDSPKCACPVISAFMRSWNDRLPDDDTRNKYLRPLLPLIVGTRATKAIEKHRGWMATDWAIRTRTPQVLRLAGLDDLAARLEALPEVNGDSIKIVRPVIGEVRDAAWKAREARWPAWKEKFLTVFKEEMTKKAASATYAASAASATYAADAAYAAEAASATYAAYATDAAGSRDWQTIRDAVYVHIREHYRANFAEIAQASNESAADLVRRMCAVKEQSHAAE